MYVFKHTSDDRPKKVSTNSVRNILCVSICTKRWQLGFWRFCLLNLKYWKCILGEIVQYMYKQQQLRETHREIKLENLKIRRHVRDLGLDILYLLWVRECVIDS
jgi:hypothetical protein